MNRYLLNTRFRPTLIELERRDTPAWWSIAAPTPAQGTLGSTVATHTGELTFSPDYEVVNGLVNVFADTATAAVVKALVGSIGVTINGQTTDYAFGAATVGSTVADNKPYLTVITGNSVALSFEDMAGQPGCDYDYNDRTWNGVSVAGRDSPQIYAGEFIWTGPSGSATVTVEVTAIDPDTYKWNYHLVNNSFVYYQGVEGESGYGIGEFTVQMADATVVEDSGSSLNVVGYTVSGGGTTDDAITWKWGDDDESPGLMPGDGADFYFTTEALPVDEESEGYVIDTLDTVESGGGCAAPGEKPVVMITDKDRVDVGENGLKVAKWENAFEYPQGKANPAFVKGVDAAGHDIIDLDPDRFNVWVHDLTKWNTVPSIDHIRVKLSTSNVARFQAYDDPKSDIDLVRYTGAQFGNGWYWSDSQMLVTNEVDDDTGRIPGVGADESAPGALGAKKEGYEWNKSDRTHRVALGGTVKAEYTFQQGATPETDTAPVKAKHTVKSHVSILNVPLNNADSGTGIVTKAEVLAAFVRANEQYAQVGVVLLEPTVKENSKWPGVLNLSNGLDYANAGQKNALLLAPELATEQNDDIEVYYVNKVKPQIPGFSFTAGGQPPEFKDKVVIASDAQRGFTLPHEIGHVLTNLQTNQGHVGNAQDRFWPNLMSELGTSMADFTTATKRLYADQDITINSERPYGKGSCSRVLYPNTLGATHVGIETSAAGISQ